MRGSCFNANNVSNWINVQCNSTLEGAGGVTYWQVKATATRQAEVELVSDPLLLRRITSIFGQTVDEVISVN